MTRRKLTATLLLLLCSALPCLAQEAESETTVQRNDSTKTFLYRFRKPIRFVTSIIDFFFETDTLYVEPNKYNWTAMLQGTSKSESFSLRDRETRSLLSFNSPSGFSIGPYVGWSILVLGYNFDLTTIGREKVKKNEFELSLYTNVFNADVFYRKTGNDFKLFRARELSDAAGQPLDLSDFYGQRMRGIQVSTIGLNAYYIANYRRVSLPAGFAQNTVQRRSAGTWKLGVGVTKHTIDLDYTQMEQQMPPLQGNNPFQASQIKYMDYSLSPGYAYNWVFRRNWLLSMDLAPSLGYKHNLTTSRGNVNFNVTGRMGLVWNNSHRYAGLSFVAHGFNYRYHDLFMHNAFFTLTCYTGFNFMKKKAYK